MDDFFRSIANSVTITSGVSCIDTKKAIQDLKEWFDEIDREELLENRLLKIQKLKNKYETTLSGNEESL